MGDIAFTVNALNVLIACGGLIALTLGWLFKIHGRVSELEGINKGKELAKEQSPLTLTDAGNALLCDSGGKKYIEDNEKSLIKNFNDLDNAFDIQEKAKDIIREKMKEPNALKNIKIYLFDNGKSVEDIVLVMGLELRDAVFKHKGIAVEQVDADKS